MEYQPFMSFCSKKRLTVKSNVFLMRRICESVGIVPGLGPAQARVVPPHRPPSQPEHKIQSRASDRWDLSLAPVPKCLGLIARQWCAGSFIVGFKVPAPCPPLA